MAMVRPNNIKMDEPVRTTTKILNLYNKSADPSNRTGSLVVTTTIPGGGQSGLDADGGEIDASEITVIFEDEIETLYVGPVEISEEEENLKKQKQAAAATAAKDRENAINVRGIRGGASTRKGPPLLLNTNASSSSGGAHSPKVGIAARESDAGQQLSPAEATESTSNGSDSGIDNCLRDDNNKSKKSTSNSPTNKDLKFQALKRAQDAKKPAEMAIKKRGRPPGSGVAGQLAQKSPKMSTTVAEEAKKATTVKKAALTPPAPKATTVVQVTKTPPRPQYECELCEEVFSREDTIVDHYQSYHRVDPKKRTIQPRILIPREEVAVVQQLPVEQQEEQEIMELEVAEEEEEQMTDIFVEVKPSPEPPARKKQENHSTARKETTATPKATKSQGLICGKCNLTFRTILLLSRHVKEMHERKVEPEDDDEEDEEDEEDADDEDRDPDYHEEPDEPQKSLIKPSNALRRKKEKENESPPERPRRGRPRKSPQSGDDTPRILNAGDETTSSSGGKRGRKRKEFSAPDSDMETVVVPAIKVKRPSTMPKTARNRTDPLAPEKMIFVEVVHDKDMLDFEGEEEEEAEDSSTATVYKIKELMRNSTSTDKDGNVKYPCPLCDMTFTRRYSLEPHIQRVHQKMRTKECTYCHRKFQSTGDLTRHLTIHTGEKPYMCSIPGCGFRFVSRSDMVKHELRHTAGVPKTYVCGTCDKPFERPYDLRRHQTTHKDMQVEFRSYKCDQCHRAFTRRDEYRAHMYRHLGVKPLKCHVCGKPFVDMSNCAKHAKGHGPLTHLGPKDPMECADCGQRFTNQTALGRHIMRCFIDRSKVPVHTVPQCDYFDEDVK